MFFPNRRPAVAKTDALICAVAIDAEEDFDWAAPIFGTPHTTSCMHHIRDLQAILGAYGIVPSYLLTHPVLEDTEAVHILRRYLARGECDVGVQLHPWVTPPYDGDINGNASYSGNLQPEVEMRKLVTLTECFTERFGRPPRIYRAGRYGLSEHTADQLEELGFEIDTSLAPRTDFSAEGGPDYSGYDYGPFWFGRRGRLLELPLCRSIVGWGGAAAPPFYRAFTTPYADRLRLSALLTRTRFAERITLSPEGNDLRAMQRMVRGMRRTGTRVFVLSLHSSSLAVGRSPYVRDRAELHHFYDRLSGILDFMARQQPIRFASLAEIPALLEPPPPRSPDA
ncbi:MAG: hypothetical protein JWP04_1492 [Belnapia sp.]|nr:hypothetical protein [Belnapia sp.]